jgi:hypothetical protein
MAAANPEGPYIAKRLTASGVVTTAGVGGYVKAFGLNVTDGGAGSVSLKDGTTSGDVLLDLTLDAATAKNSISSGNIGPVRFNTDCYATLAGTGATAWVVYNQDSE